MAFIALQTFSLVHLLLLFTCTALLSSHDEDCLALFEFKQTIFHQNSDAVGFQKWRKVKSNISDSDFCLSDGVVCSYTGHVIGLDWSGSSLNGVINSSSTLFKLVHLQMLNLSMNNIVESQIPSEIARLKQLRSLDLSYSGFNGQIPNEISHLIQLSSLDLSWNPLKLQRIIPESVSSLNHLEVLSLGRCNFSGHIPGSLPSLTHLTILSLYKNEFIGLVPSLGQISSSFLNFKSLELLAISFNNFSGKVGLDSFLGKIPSLICEMKSIRFLDLSSNKMTGSLPPCLENLSNSLSALILKRNNFHGPKMNKCTHGSLLERIDLSENRFTGLVSKSLADCTNLEFLSLADNTFEDVFPLWLGTLPSLQVLILRADSTITPRSSWTSNNHFTGSILPSLGNLNNLESLDLSHNELSGQIPQKFLQLGFLAILNVSFNHLDGQIPQGKQFNTFENNSYLGNLEFGLAIVIVNGSFLYARYGGWLLERLGMKKDKWVRPLSNRGISKPVLNPPQLIDSFIFVHSSSLSLMAKSIHVFALILALRYVLESSLATKFSSLSHADECSLLFQFIESMSVNSYASSDLRAHPKFALWNLNRSEGATSCCLWDGVECRSGHVIGLDLSSNLLYGPNYANSSLFNLIHLHSLNIADI
ncbi:hypothetical protein L1987_84685 [Smallanthus sonchifolius]|uniref:Uncharacterized protein n=1 Tax=Smallanthus sonchifolius TaxID=185202 RepID=A0ACB8XUZ9_9ASTR|nr:hypothetical protein L1987_84685 [Smallanthus sonchifolius]